MADALSGLLPLGLALIAVGMALTLVPLLMRQGVSWDMLQQIHPLLLYVYRTDGFTFATSPVLVLSGLAIFLWRYFLG